MSPIKEPHFFSMVAEKSESKSYNPWITNEDEYHQLFEGAGDFPIIGEASTSYLWAFGTAERIKAKVADPRIIILLRDPVERAYSHYLMEVRANREVLPFYEAIIKDYNCERKGWHINNLYVELGMYHQQILPYWTLFNRNRLLILMFNDLRERPDLILQKVATFLNINIEGFTGLDPNKVFNPYLAPSKSLLFIKNNPRLNQIFNRTIPLSLRATIRNRYFMRPGKKPPIDEQAVDFLSRLYKPDIEALEDLLSRDLPSLKGHLDSD